MFALLSGKCRSTFQCPENAQALFDTWECISSFGTFVEFEKTDIYRNSGLNMQPSDRNVSFSSVDVT